MTSQFIKDFIFDVETLELEPVDVVHYMCQGKNLREYTYIQNVLLHLITVSRFYELPITMSNYHKLVKVTAARQTSLRLAAKYRPKRKPGRKPKPQALPTPRPYRRVGRPNYILNLIGAYDDPEPVQKSEPT